MAVCEGFSCCLLWPQVDLYLSVTVLLGRHPCHSCIDTTVEQAIVLGRYAPICLMACPSSLVLSLDFSLGICNNLVSNSEVGSTEIALLLDR